MRLLSRLRDDQNGAVAPTVALSLIGLIAAGGLAFDYAHLARLDTELQQAADQAALAAATQLDGQSGACSRAAAAAASLLSNQSRFANDGGGGAVIVNSESTCDASGSVRFYQSYDESTDTPGTAATQDKDAKVVIVAVNGRKAKYAWTPIVGVFESGTIGAQAVATLSSSICKVPPLMFCAPNTSFPGASDIGRGVMLEPGSGSAWVAGNYGYLDFGNGASGTSTNLGSNNQTASCTDATTGVPTEPGNQASVTKALNSRFDLYPPSASACDPSTGNFCPAEDVVKDMSRTEVYKVDGTATTVPANPGCGAAGGTVSDFAYDSTVTALGRDSDQASCAANQNCIKFGNKAWNKTEYALANYGMTADALATAVGKSTAEMKRWDVYQWELKDKPARLPRRLLNPGDAPDAKPRGKSGVVEYTFTNRCAYAQPINGTAVVAGPAQKDRRTLSVAVVDCTGQTGKFNSKILRFVDLFLVQPSLDRTLTSKDQIYAEIVKVTDHNGESAFQYYLRQRPRLLK